VADRPQYPESDAWRDDTGEPRVVRRPRRPPKPSRLRRGLTGLGIVVVFALVVGGAGAAWGLWSFARINRVDLDLAQAERAAPRNFLVVGSDSREQISADDPDADGMLGPEAPSGQRADSIMVVRVDPRSERVDLLSVPRDLWVPIGTDGDKQRINSAYSVSAQAVVDTVRDSLGIPIHNFVEVDFRGFQSLVDALGGVPMYFENPVRDTNSGLSVPTKGCMVLDGYQGLAFARARHLQWSDGVAWHSDPTGDLGRATRQQLLTRAAMAQAQSMGIGDIGKLRKLVDAGLDSVTLDGSIGAGDLIEFGNQLSGLDPDRMQTHALAVEPYTTDGGAAVVLLDRVAAQPVLDIFRGDVSKAPVTTTTVPPPTPDEVTVDVFNGSGVDGEARRVSYVLDGGGFVGGQVETAEGTQARTTVEYPPGADRMAELVTSWLHPDAEVSEDDGLAPATVRVTLGRDFDSVYEPAEGADDATNASPDAPAGGSAVPDDGPPAVEASPVTVTTTTQPGWVPGSPPAGVSCP
jgi:polyisoprenyl-teichoic acid--peptidoglycan teichoic acid transferase